MDDSDKARVTEHIAKITIRQAEILELMGETAFANALREVCDLHCPTEETQLRPGLRITYLGMPATVKKLDDKGFVYLIIDAGHQSHSHRRIQVGSDAIKPLRRLKD